MENKPRYLTICSSPWNHPKVFIQGLWVEGYGFEVGAQVTITNPEKGTLVMKQTKSARVHYREKRKRVLEANLIELQNELNGIMLPSVQKEKQAEVLSILRELEKVA